MNETHSPILDQIAAADVAPIRRFFFFNPSQPLLATGSGGCDSVSDFLALLYAARGGVAAGVTPYTYNSYSDAALKTAKLLIVSKGGHNNDAVFAARRSLEVNPANTAGLFFHDGDRNKALKFFRKAGSQKGFVIPLHGTHEGFVSSGTSLAYFSLLVRIFQPEADILKYKDLPRKPFILCRNDGSSLMPADFRGVHNYIFLHGSWGRPVARNLESKLVETGLAAACVCDYRNYCHGRFIFSSQHLEDAAIILFISPREKDIARRTREFLPASAKLVIIETVEDAPEATLDLLIRATEFFHALCTELGANPASPANPGKIDKRKPIWVPFMAEMKRNGALSL